MSVGQERSRADGRGHGGEFGEGKGMGYMGFHLNTVLLVEFELNATLHKTCTATSRLIERLNTTVRPYGI